MLRAARLEIGLYEEVEADITATGQALQVVLIAALANGLGELVAQVLTGHPLRAIGALVWGVVVGVVGWVLWSYVTYFIGTRLLNGTATPGEMLRTIGFAHAPGVLYIFKFIPVLGGLIALVVAIWLLIAGIIAVRQALDFTTGKALATTILGWLAMAIPLLLLGGLVLATMTATRAALGWF